MVEFGTEAVFDATVDSGSLRDTRRTVEEELGDIEVQVAAQVDGAGGGGGGNAARDRGLARRNQSRQIDTLGNIHDAVAEQPTSDSVVDEWETEHQLSETRNELLRELVDVQEQSNYDQSARGGRGGVAKLLGGAVGAIGLGALAGVAGAASSASNALDGLGNLSPSDVVSAVALTADDVVSPVSLTASDVIDSPASIGVGDVVGATAAVTAPALVGSTASVAAGDVVGALASVAATDVISGTASIGPGDVIGSPVSLDVAAVIASPVSIAVGDLIGEAPTLTAEDVLSALGIGSAAASGSDQPSGNGSSGGSGGLLEGLQVNAEDVITGGSAAAAGTGLLAKFLSNTGKTAGGAAGVMAGLPSMIAAQSAQNSQQRPKDQQTWFDRLIGDTLENAGGGNGDGGGVSPMMITPMGMPTGTDQGNGGDPGRERTASPTINHSSTWNVDLSDIERQLRQERREIQKEIDQLRDSLS